MRFVWRTRARQRRAVAGVIEHRHLFRRVNPRQTRLLDAPPLSSRFATRFALRCRTTRALFGLVALLSRRSAPMAERCIKPVSYLPLCCPGCQRLKKSLCNPKHAVTCSLSEAFAVSDDNMRGIMAPANMRSRCQAAGAACQHMRGGNNC